MHLILSWFSDPWLLIIKLFLLNIRIFICHNKGALEFTLALFFSRRSFEFLDLLLQEWQTHSLERYDLCLFFSPENYQVQDELLL